MARQMIKSLAKKDKIAAIDKIGLDFHYDNSERDNQRKAFRKQIRLANEPVTCTSVRPASLIFTMISVASASTAFSISSFTTEAGR